MSELLVDVSHLVGKPGASKNIDGLERLAGLEVPLGKVDQDSGVVLALIVSSLAEGVSVEGSVSGVMQLACSRCLVEFEEPFDYEVDETFTLEEVEDGYVVEEEKIDLLPMLTDLILPGIPLSPLHSKTCKGLCPVCGEDLNVIDCGHDASPKDLRWAPLESLADKMKGD